MNVVTIERKILEKNDEIAGINRQLLQSFGIWTVNIISAPGAGKTCLLERTLEVLKEKIQIGVIEGDVQTDLDARRIAGCGVPAVQIVTRGGCHLEADLVRDALKRLELNRLKLLFIENVGNLVCPANYDLGEDVKVIVVSTTEGDDKPLKYPTIFRKAETLVINKIDLLPHLPCNIEVLRGNALSINPHLRVFETSSITGVGIKEWCDWLATSVASTGK